MDYGSGPLMIFFIYIFVGIIIQCLSDPEWYAPADISKPKIGLEYHYEAEAEAQSFAHAAIWLNQNE